jgi:hypothetical protein
MVTPHPRLDVKNKDFLLGIEAEQFELHGDICKPVIDLLYNIFSWIYIDGYFRINSIENEAIRDILIKYDLDTYKGPGLSYSTILLYADLSRKYNMRKLGEGKMVPVEESSNKLFPKSHFLFDDLYKLYNTSKGDLSTDFLLFNEIFETAVEKEIVNIKSPSEVVKTISKTSLIRPDFEYKLATRQLQVNHLKENNENSDKTIYVLQDCTESTIKYKQQINMLKGFILNEAFKNDYVVEWLFVESYMVDSQRFSKETIKQTKMKDITFGSKINITKLLTEDRFLAKQVIIITDGTDPFNFKFNTKTKKINVVSLTDNINIKNKISNYGRFFKVFTS